MNLILIAVGTRMPAWVDDAFAEYQKRMPRETALRLLTVKPEKREGGKTAAQAMAAEAQRIAAALPKTCLRVVLDERGQQVSSTALAERMQAWMAGGRDVALIVGGADGLATAIKDEADWAWSLSALTLPHGLVRVLVAEQLYRAVTILQGHPYHRE